MVLRNWRRLVKTLGRNILDWVQLCLATCFEKKLIGKLW
jgi:hypothetical protein